MSSEADYAVPAAVPSSRRRERVPRVAAEGLWGGRQRARLKAGCWGAAVLLSLPLVVPLLIGDPTGADSPEAAVAQLLQGIADIDPVAIVGSVDPVETADRERAAAAYDRLSSRLLRNGEETPADVTAVVLAAEAQVGGSDDLTSVAIVAALDLELDGLELRVVPSPVLRGVSRVYLLDGDLDVVLDPGRLPDSVEGLERATYSMPLAEGWRRDVVTPIEPFLVAVERDGRWFVSLEQSADALLPARRGRRR